MSETHSFKGGFFQYHKVMLMKSLNLILERANTRALAAGDSFSPSEMLPIAQKLLSKVEPGKGHGFVSSTLSPQELADKLFEAFFATTKRIVFLNDEDLPGIDALQALALSGEIADSKQDLIVVTEPGEIMYLRVVSKPVDKQAARSSGKSNRRRINLARYLNKKRHLIVNQQRRKNRVKKVTDYSESKKTKVTTQLMKNGKSNATVIEHCRWKYGCSDIVNLDTCRIRSVCANVTTNKTDGRFL
ncbi:uncharacterized protein LOC120636975 [Pararge aegeria]|uniref:uncharacterized protein LOC120636975 n=1 Tax=Pararge aegeria TaxID=116150 RepID=UPI0019CF8990|nr:uncharacterized protein LOC120636975 [Pararge aegeria]